MTHNHMMLSTVDTVVSVKCSDTVTYSSAYIFLMKITNW